MKRLAPALAAGLLLFGAAPVGAKAAARWQNDASVADHKRLAKLWEAWTHAVAEAAAAENGAALAALGPVAVPDAATMNVDASDPMTAPPLGPLPGPGAYRCRTIRLGGKAGAVPGQQGGAVPAVQAGVAHPCTITARDGGLWFEEAQAPSRLGGRLYPDGDRMVFLGAAALAGEMTILSYGADAERDAVGALRAMAPGQWRLELPRPHWQSTLDLIEITPG